MKQISLGASRLEISSKTTRKRVFLDEMNAVVPWAELVGLIQPHAPTGKTGRPPFSVETLLHIHIGMKAHIGVDAEPGLVHTVIGKAANIHDVTQANALLHGQESSAHGDAGYQGANKRPNARQDIAWYITMRPGKRRALNKANAMHAVPEKIEKLKASVRAKVEHPFQVIKRQFGHVKVRYRGLKKNTAQLHTLFALSNLSMVRGKLMAQQA